MARGTQFQVLVQRLRAELNRSTSVAVGVDDLDNLKQVINRVYQTLLMEYDWPHLRRVFPRIDLAVDQQYYDFPDDLDPERIERAALWYGGEPHDIERGISFEEYAGFDTTTGETSEPAMRWDIRFTGTTDQIEVWPMPNSAEQQLEFIGIQRCPRLVDDDDLCKLDDDLIVMFAAAEKAAKDKHADAQLKLQAAQQHLHRLKGRSKPASKSYRVGLGPTDDSIRSGRAIVRVR